MSTRKRLKKEEEERKKLYSYNEIDCKIRQRRGQILVHSCLYYQLDESIVSDFKFDQWAYELVELQKEKHYIGFYDEDFLDFDGSTGYHLPYNIPNIIHKARCILETHKKINMEKC